MGRAVAAAEGLRERVAEREHRAAERGSGVAGAAQQLPARLGSPASQDDQRQPGADQLGAGEGVAVALRRPLRT